MINPYCLKHGHWACPKCGMEDTEEDVKRKHMKEKAELLSKLAEAIKVLQSVKACSTCPACSIQAGAILERWSELKDE